MRNLDVQKTEFQGGDVEISGFKHSFVAVVAGCLAARGQVIIRNAPDILERNVFGALLSDLGCRVDLKGSKFLVDCGSVNTQGLNPALSRCIHGSMYLIPALVAARGYAAQTPTGGCAIGDGAERQRPFEHFIRIMSEFGVHPDSERNAVFRAAHDGLKAANIDIMAYSEMSNLLTGPYISGATKAALICAAGVGTTAQTIVKNPYSKPDVSDLSLYLSMAGFAVQHSETLISVSHYRPVSAVQIDLTPDLSEIMTYVTLSVLMKQPIILRAHGMSRAYDGLVKEREVLKCMGISLTLDGDSLSASASETIKTVDIDVTSVGIYSDHQPFFALLLTQGDRPATIREFVWKTRFDYVDELGAFGANIEKLERGIRIYPSVLSPPNRPIVAHDLRMAGMLLVAALAVGGGVELREMHHLVRGYPSILRNLERMGTSLVNRDS